ncbi:DUF4393 domain-containing protein [Paenibacillus sinopodophylli]|uniref:DUF4393 domain-containing protein n=1 Tax=Paenibacillus sinopodophylli TaxID=1837342 RepID=UPI00110CF439|nr:DUF4393 domain-containing protein [Paenibacillus sinopodophylli]
MISIIEENNSIENVNTFQLPQSITTSALEPAAKQIGEGFGNLFYLIFSPIEKAKIKKEHDISVFKSELESEILKIPVDQLTEPPLNIVGPALEASKYHIEDTDIRSMFVKLISSSMTQNNNNIAHSAFVEIIKQLSPLDAKTLLFLYNNRPVGFGKIRLNHTDPSKGGQDWIKNFFPFPEMDIDNMDHYSASIDNIKRLGIVFTDHTTSFIDKSQYDSIKNHDLYKHLHELAIKTPDHPFFKDRAIHFNESVWGFTSFGNHFVQCCL